MYEHMFSQAVANAPNRIVDVAWMLMEDKASMIWADPASLGRAPNKEAAAKSVQFCPAAIDFDARHFVVTAPFDIHIRFGMDEQKRPALKVVEGANGSIRPKHLSQMVSIVPPAEWRHPERPIVQVMTPYVFVADEPVYLNQLPPYLHYTQPSWPGLLIGGRFPINVWPRPLMFAFEWHDTKQDLWIKRGQPLFYLRFEAFDPSRAVRLSEGVITPDIKRYIDSLSGVTNYVNRTFSLFERAQKRRPERLVVKREG